MDGDHYIDTNAETNPEQSNLYRTNPRSTKFGLLHKSKLNCIDEYRYCLSGLS